MNTKRQRLRRLLLVATLLLSIQSANAQDGNAFGRYWAAYATVNSFSWDNLREIEPLGRGGPFTTSGTGLEFGAYTSVARWGSVWLLAGTELSFFGFNFGPLSSDEPKTESNLGMDHWTVSMAFRFGQPGGRYLDLDLGVGEYHLESKYIDCIVIVSCFQADTGDSEMGAYLGISGTVGKGIVLGARIHHIDFDPIEAIDLGVRRIRGPIYSIFVGWEYGNWGRR